MLRVSKLTDYGVVVMTFLARESDRLHAASEIAGQIHVAAPTVSKILKALTRTGLVLSHRGVKGGYSLARAAADISVVEIIDALEGPVGLTECGSNPGVCSQEASCSIRANWQHINGAVRGALAGVSLAQMAQPATHIVTPPRSPSAARARAL